MATILCENGQNGKPKNREQSNIKTKAVTTYSKMYNKN